MISDREKQELRQWGRTLSPSQKQSLYQEAMRLLKRAQILLLKARLNHLKVTQGKRQCKV